MKLHFRTTEITAQPPAASTTIFRVRNRTRALTRTRNRIIDKTYFFASRYINIQMDLQIKFQILQLSSTGDAENILDSFLLFRFNNLGFEIWDRGYRDTLYFSVEIMGCYRCFEEL